MSEEELNQELSTDELKDVSGGFLSGCGKAQIKGDLKTGDLLGKKGRKQTESLDATQFGNLRPKIS